jgi:hypothetical protein
MNFASAMQAAAELLAAFDASAPDGAEDTDLGGRLQQFLQSEEGARGFFVSLLTGDFKASDQPPQALLEAIRTAPATAHNVLAKNLVMSAATEVVHKRNGDAENAAGSTRVLTRTKHLFKASDSSNLKARAQEMLASIDKRSQSFAPFLSRVNYDAEQTAAARNALRDVLN